MFQTNKTFLLCVVLIGLLLFPIAAAADDGVELEKVITSFTPVYMDGHDGDMNYMEGFTGTGDIYLGATKAGTFTAAVTLINPPVGMTEQYEYAKIKFVNTIAGMGSFEVNGMALLMGSSTGATSLVSTLSWSGSVSNGTGSLSNLVGLSAGTAQADLMGLKAEGKELLLYRFNY